MPELPEVEVVKQSLEKYILNKKLLKIIVKNKRLRDPVPKNICPEFILGSHKWNKKFLPTKFFGNDYEHKDKDFENIPNIEDNKHLYKIISWKLNLGDAIAFNFSTIHGAPSNISNNKRRAFSVRFTGDDSTYIKRKGEMSPPFPNLTLKNGDILDCETFPVLISS